MEAFGSNIGCKSLKQPCSIFYSKNRKYSLLNVSQYSHKCSLSCKGDGTLNGNITVSLSGYYSYISFWNCSHLIFYSTHHICQNITELPSLTILSFHENTYSNYVCKHKLTPSFADYELVKNFQFILGKYSKKQPHYVTHLNFSLDTICGFPQSRQP